MGTCSKGPCDPGGSCSQPPPTFGSCSGEAHCSAEDPEPLSQEEVDQLHQRYIKELCDLFEAHKLKYNVPIDQHLDFC